MKEFSAEVTKKLGYYVYLYLDPETKEVFYVGKGRGNRAFQHLSDRSESEKVQRIEEIRARGQEPQIEILCHGLTSDKQAYRVEAAAIDLLTRGQLTNVVRGWRSGLYGRMSVAQIQAQYGAKEATVTEPAILIRINDLFRYGMLPIELYDATRSSWKVGRRREAAELAFAVFEGVIQEVYRIRGWHPAGQTLSTRGAPATPGRWEFVGDIAGPSIREKYLYKSVRLYFQQGSQNPIRYVNL
jgi:hypothetical protein